MTPSPPPRSPLRATLSLLTLGLAAGGSVLQSALLANCAGGCVVQKIGTATLTPDELTSAASAIDPTSVGGVA